MSTEAKTVDDVLFLLHTQGPFVWRLEGDLLRTYRGTQCLCPLTAVCLLATGETYDLALWEDAAQQLGLSPTDARALQDAADHGEAALDPALRHRLLTLLSKEHA